MKYRYWLGSITPYENDVTTWQYFLSVMLPAHDATQDINYERAVPALLDFLNEHCAKYHIEYEVEQHGTRHFWLVIYSLLDVAKLKFQYPKITVEKYNG